MEQLILDTKIKNDAFDYLNENLPRYLEILKQMVAINSFTANADGVNRLGELTATVFEELGFVAERVFSENPFHGDHLILSRPAKIENKNPTIALVSHLDTVFPPDEEKRNDFSWRIDGDRIYGPGTVDIKGGTVVIYMMLAVLNQIAPNVFNNVNWIVLLNSAEETLEPQFGNLCRARISAGARACLVFEGGRRRGPQFYVVTARKGMATYRIVVEGKAAHAGSSHHNGANAITQLAHTISQIALMTDYEQGITFNVGTIAGGTVINRVPHFAVASGEMRAFTPESLGKGVARLQAIQDDIKVQSVNNGYHCDVEITIMSRWSPWPRNEATDLLLSTWQEAGSSLGFEVLLQERGGLSDGNFLWNHVPTLDGLGPAGGNAHCSERSDDGSKEQEFVKISSFIPKVLLNTLAVLKLLDQEV